MEFLQPAEQFIFLAETCQHVGQGLVGPRALVGQVFGIAGLQRRKRLGRFAGLGVHPGQIELPQGLVGGRLVGLLEHGLCVLRPVGRQEALAHELVGRARIAEQHLGELPVKGELVGVINGVEHAGKALCRLLVLLREKAEPAHFHPQEDVGGGFLALAPGGQGPFVKRHRACPIAFFGEVGAKAAERHRVGVLQLGGLQCVADRLGVALQLNGHGNDRPGNRGRLRITSQGALVGLQSGGVFFPLLVHPAGGEQRQGLETVALGLGPRFLTRHWLGRVVKNERTGDRRGRRRLRCDRQSAAQYDVEHGGAERAERMRDEG